MKKNTIYIDRRTRKFIISVLEKELKRFKYELAGLGPGISPTANKYYNYRTVFRRVNRLQSAILAMNNLENPKWVPLGVYTSESIIRHAESRWSPISPSIDATVQRLKYQLFDAGTIIYLPSGPHP